MVDPWGRDQLLRRRASSFAVRLLGLQDSDLPEFRKRFRLATSEAVFQTSRAVSAYFT